MYLLMIVELHYAELILVLDKTDVLMGYIINIG